MIFPKAAYGQRQAWMMVLNNSMQSLNIETISSVFPAARKLKYAVAYMINSSLYAVNDSFTKIQLNKQRPNALD